MAEISTTKTYDLTGLTCEELVLLRESVRYYSDMRDPGSWDLGTLRSLLAALEGADE
ncbi:hypothetical protein [Streptomyces sp. 5-10]|uniref:hypothetical protein n=1 Tax=Streptomyces sp. 5-10 TaxID=878925 RepID=UPI00168BA7CF|nr:hypothetical protein [Streptomyces sp. 5-10]MBD3004786.1 hypothetical protein [Streptomyces sp. 5-10]